jgi:L-malate glycosyltransferase
MRVLYFSREYTTHDRRFLEKLAASEHEVWFLRLEDDGLGYEQRPLPAGVHIVPWSAGRRTISGPESCWQLMPEFCEILHQLDPDLVHAGPVQSCGLMTAIAGIHPFLLMSWGSDILVDADRDKMWQWMTRYTLERSDMLACDCNAVRAKVQQIVPYAADRIVQFPWGVDLHKFSLGSGPSPVRERAGWQDAFIVISTRSWEPVYGIDVLLKGFATAYTRESRLRLLLLGNGSLESELNQLIEKLGIREVVLRPGRTGQADITDYFRAADAYLSCAHSDGTSISLLEALATGLPAIVTDGPGNREWVVPDQNGWLAPVGNVSEVARLLLHCASLDKTQRLRISEANRRVAEARADWERNSSRLLEAYACLQLRARKHESK